MSGLETGTVTRMIDGPTFERLRAPARRQGVRHGLFCLAALLLAAWPCAAAPKAEPHGQPIIAGQSLSISSAVLGAPREINVWTPPDYAKSKRSYPVVYLLDGGREQDFSHIAGLAQLSALSGTFGPFIVVGVRSEARRSELAPPAADPRYGKTFPDAGHDAAFRDFLRREVIPYVDSHYRAGPRRVLMGESLAGLFVVDTFLTEPTMFDDYVAVSPSLWWDDQAAGRSAAARLRARGRTGNRLYLTIANEGEATQSGMDALVAALKSAPTGAVTWKYIDRSREETHATILHPAALDALRWLFPVAEPDYGPSPWYYLNSGAAADPRGAGR